MKLNQTLMAVTFAAGALALAGNADASNVYDVNEVLTDTAGVGGIAGTITTDGTVGELGTADILAWDLTVTGNDGTSFVLVNGSSGVRVSNQSNINADLGTPDLTADANHIYFDFSQTDGGFLLFQTAPFFGGQNYASFAAFNSAGAFQGLTAVPNNTFDPNFINEPVSDSGPQSIATIAVPEPTTMALMFVAFVTGLLLKMRKIAAA
jgi:hypothetical protein